MVLFFNRFYDIIYHFLGYEVATGVKNKQLYDILSDILLVTFLRRVQTLIVPIGLACT